MEEESLNVRPLSLDLLPLAERFRSGNTYLDGFLRNGDYSLSADIGKTYVFLAEGDIEIIGYYNLGMSSVDRIEDVNGISRYIRMGGAVNINYFALDERYHRQVFDILPSGDKIYLSDILLVECLERIENIINQHIGTTFVTLNSTKEGYNLYRRNGFEELEMDMRFTMEDSDYECTQLYRWINEDF